ncbi:hypothetical protein FCL47_21010 [Desulfopila sp. IMCC35006]|uniref:hypothetical protein n=1 Tax=Desulfopila sp. IMCC35006 TaxID=2569542 RepID=UPI0010AD9495|nr:hypothetical protein [Desulfopila sp. IMCC35006]TKB23815.1 hypothetical protein FCL47_21010 [Desulfopila sp. IMCC35006]
MPAGSAQRNNTRLIAWNGVQLTIPKAWDARVSGNHHLVFEKNFQPLVQIRWEQSVHDPSRNLQKRVRHWAAELGAVVTDTYLPEDLQQLQVHWEQVSYYRDNKGIMKGGICFCAACNTLILFHILTSDPALMQEICSSLSTLSCSNPKENLWCIQDFSLMLPASYTLQDYTFAAGLTRLSFLSSDIFLQTCSLGPADLRLTDRSLQQILAILTNASHLQIVAGKSGNSCEGFRCPTVVQQVFFRLRREKPFIRAAIRHDTDNNRLLAVVLSANRPIAPTSLQQINQRYEIIQP